MEGTLGLRVSPTVLQGLRLIVLSQVHQDSGPAWEGKLLLIIHVREQFVCTVRTVQTNWFPAVCLYSAYCTSKLVSCSLLVQCMLYKQTVFLSLELANADTIVLVLD